MSCKDKLYGKSPTVVSVPAIYPFYSISVLLYMRPNCNLVLSYDIWGVNKNQGPNARI